MPLLVEALRACTTSGIWLWGDQALIDIGARDSLVGRNLLGVYDRYGWHHPGPLWLLVLGVFRWLGGGSPEALIFGSCVLQGAAAAAIVLVANRLRSGLTGWLAALLLLGYEWSLGLDRLGTVWAPYAIALPTALFVLLIAYVVLSDRPWPATVAAAVCASFLLQTDIGTIVIVTVLVLATPVLRLAVRVQRRGEAGPEAGRRWSLEPGWGWSKGNWRLGATSLVAAVVVLWLPPGIEQVTTRPGNVVQVYRFVSTHPAEQSLESSLEAADTVFGSFPFRGGERTGRQDSNPVWLVAGSIGRRPWYLVYLLVTVATAAVAALRRRRQALALSTASGVAVLAAGLSFALVYGPLYPYLVFWTGAVVVPTWIACWLALVPAPAPQKGKRESALLRLGATHPRARFTVPVATLVAAASVSTSFIVYPFPLAGVTSVLGHRSWQFVSADVLAARVRTVYIDIDTPDAMPDAAAIADQAVRRDRRVEVNRAALYYFDPSFAPTAKAQLKVLVCCGRNDPGEPPVGYWFSGHVGGQYIFTSAPSGTSSPLRPSRVGEPFVRTAEMVPHGVDGGVVDDGPGHDRERL
jgi:hypothetical protein